MLMGHSDTVQGICTITETDKASKTPYEGSQKKILIWLQAEIGNCSVIMERKHVLVIDVTEESWGGRRR